MKKFFLIVSIFLFVPYKIFAVTTVTSVPQGSSSVSKYSKYEITFSLSRTYPAGSFLPYYFYDPDDTPANDPNKSRTSPFGVDGITVNTIFTSPTGKTYTVPSFYYQDYSRTRSGNYEVLTKLSSDPVWKTRFTPSEVGTYTYYLTVTDKDGSSRYPTSGTLSFTSQSSNSKGFIRQSTRDPRFLDYETGSSFIPISQQAQWWECCTLKSYSYDDRFAQYKTAGINMVRIWDQNDGYALALEGTADHHLTDAEAIAAPKGTIINQAEAYREDKIFESAETNGIAIELCSHGDIYWNWDASIYNEGWNPNPVSFSNKYHVNYWKRNFRYRVARYGYSTSLLSWENWNELGHVPVGSDVDQFYQTYGAYQKNTDPYSHLRTTSQGSQAYSPGFWSTAANDLANYHDYMMISRYDASLTNDEANFVYRFAQCLRTPMSGCMMGDGSAWSGGPKPFIWGEIGILTTWDQQDNTGVNGEGGIRARQNEMWAGLFSPIGSVPIEWNGPDASTTTTILNNAKVISKFFSTIDYNKYKFDHLPTADISMSGYSGDKLTSSNSNLRSLVLRSSDKKAIFAWVQNKAYTWKNYSSTPTAASASITIPNVPAGTYTTEYWDTSTGVVTPGSTLTANGSLTFSVSNIQKSVAIKILSTSTSTTILGDANGDGKVNGSDYVIWLTHYGQLVSGASVGDFNNSGKVDGADFTTWLSHYSP